MNFLHEFFGERINSKGLWPPCSSNLSPPDLFLCGYLKEKIYKNRPQNLDELKRNITIEIYLININVLHKEATNVKKCVRAGINEQV